MATTWEIRLPQDDPAYARQAASAAFLEVDRLENLLSRFREGGEIWRLNRLPREGRMLLSEETHACLWRALQLSEITGRAFHPGLGAVMDRVRADGDWLEALDRLDAGCLAIGESDLCVECVDEGVSVDLGAIGKGFALDRVRRLLNEWGFSSMLLIAGGSSVIAAGDPWEVRLLGDAIRPVLQLRDVAVGSSGTSVQGNHGVDIRRRTRQPRHHRSWAFCRDAADADALSTAAMLMDAEEIGRALDGFGQPAAILLETLEDTHLVRKIHSRPEGFAGALGLPSA